MKIGLIFSVCFMLGLIPAIAQVQGSVNETNDRQKILDFIKKRPLVMKLVDLNGNGEIEENEVAEARKLRQEWLNKYDANKNGRLDKEEMSKVRDEFLIKRPGIIKRFDSNGDGKIDESEKAAAESLRAEKISRYDTDGDGKLSETERKVFRKEAFIENIKNRPGVMKQIDTDGDGVVSDSEFEKAKEKRTELIKKYDKDGDSRLNQEERKVMRTELIKDRPQLIRKFDANNDGKLDDSEIQAMKDKRDEIRNKWDADKDGKLSDDEKFNIFIENVLKRPGLMKRLDLNNNGIIDPDEKENARKLFLEKRGAGKGKNRWSNTGEGL